MASHGYGPMTFRYEKDAAGAPLVHRLDGEHDDAHYLRGGSTFSQIWKAYELRHRVYFVVLDISRDRLPSGAAGAAAGSKERGMAYVPAVFSFETVAHELAHAFGMMWHDFRDPTYILSGGGQRRNRLSSCSAGFLSVSPWFNPDTPHEKDWPQVSSIEFVGSSRWYPAGSRQVTVPLRGGRP